MGTRPAVATDGARVMVWMGEDEREIMVEGGGGMEEGASCATEMKNTQVKLRAHCVVLYVSGPSVKFYVGRMTVYGRFHPYSSSRLRLRPVQLRPYKSLFWELTVRHP
jgi:hypothetical protein